MTSSSPPPPPPAPEPVEPPVDTTSDGGAPVPTLKPGQRPASSPDHRGALRAGPEAGAFEKHAYDRIADVLVVLSEVASGVFEAHLPSLPESDPFSTLFRGVNETIASLAESRMRSDLYQRELEEKLQTIDQQRLAIRELSTPVIEVWSGVLCLPIVGLMDADRSAEITETLLSAIARSRARSVIVDITGIEVMDTATADHFLSMARAVRLLGAQCILTGIRPGIAQSLIRMGLDLGGLVTQRTLRDALAAHLRAQGPGAAAAK